MVRKLLDFINMTVAKFVKNNNIAKKLAILDTNSKPCQLFNFGCNNGLFNEDQINNDLSFKTNYNDVKDKIIEEYIKEETASLLNKLESLNYFFNNQ